MESYPRTLPELEERFATEQACREYLIALRWPNGFVCPRCGGGRAWATGRGLWLCGGCRHQASATAGTIFQDTHLPLTLWFRAIWQVTAQKNGILTAPLWFARAADVPVPMLQTVIALAAHKARGKGLWK